LVIDPLPEELEACLSTSIYVIETGLFKRSRTAHPSCFRMLPAQLEALQTPASNWRGIALYSWRLDARAPPTIVPP
jgi:hypothetical protein